jgi:DNA processing protein
VNERTLEYIDEFKYMKKAPKQIYSRGDLSLLKRAKISIVGSRKPTNYTKDMTHKLSNELSKRGICIVSGGAMGVDAIAHNGAGAANSIAVLPCGVDIKYPSINRNLLASIENNGLIISQFEVGFKATPWSFVLRNEIVVALGEILIVTQAEIDSGSMRSVEYALQMGKKIFVLPHRIGESCGTNKMVKDGNATPIYDIEEFVSAYGIEPQNANQPKDDFFYFIQTNPTLDDAVNHYGARIYELELSGEIAVRDGRVKFI